MAKLYLGSSKSQSTLKTSLSVQLKCSCHLIVEFYEIIAFLAHVNNKPPIFHQ